MHYRNFIYTLLAILLFSWKLKAGVLEHSHVTGLYGQREFTLFLPHDGLEKNLPLIVMLHGCEQSAEDFGKSTRILEWAEKENFAVLLPDQSKLYNPFKCWNWIIPGNNTRFGEPSVVISMIDQVIKKKSLDHSRVFVAGMSAGASLAGILGNCYPERFKAIASHDGVQFYPTYTGADFLTVVLNGANVPSEQAAYWGNTCSTTLGRPKQMPIIIFHGLSSLLMNPLHAYQVENEFIAFNDYLDDGLRNYSTVHNKKIESFPDNDKYGYTLYQTFDQNDQIFIERYMINKLNHSWSGGDGNFTYNDPHGPDATAFIIHFFKRFGL